MAPAPTPLRLEALAESIGLGTPRPLDVGRAEAETGPWRFTFSLPSWTSQGDDGVLRIDAAGRASFEPRGGDGSEEGLREAARRRMADLGWPDPAFQDAEAAIVVC